MYQANKEGGPAVTEIYNTLSQKLDYNEMT